jgi:hypothetical protein
MANIAEHRRLYHHLTHNGVFNPLIDTPRIAAMIADIERLQARIDAFPDNPKLLGKIERLESSRINSRETVLRLKGEIKKLTNAIKEAPHTFKCNAIPKNNGLPCTCWKSVILQRNADGEALDEGNKQGS